MNKKGKAKSSNRYGEKRGDADADDHVLPSTKRWTNNLAWVVVPSIGSHHPKMYPCFYSSPSIENFIN